MLNDGTRTAAVGTSSRKRIQARIRARSTGSSGVSRTAG